MEWSRLKSRTHTLSFDVLDGERCGETLQSIFENAKDPDKVMIGLVEQNSPEVRQVEHQSFKSDSGFPFSCGSVHSNPLRYFRINGVWKSTVANLVSIILSKRDRFAKIRQKCSRKQIFKSVHAVSKSDRSLFTPLQPRDPCLRGV
jgi:hypothetical protein